MRSRLSGFLSLLFVCLAVSAQADISSISPSSLYVGDVETFVTVGGTGLTGSVSTMVVFSGPGGTFSVEPSLGSSTSLQVFVPIQVASVAGHYSVQVETDNGSGPVLTPAASFDVVERVDLGPPLIGLPETIIAEASGPLGSTVFFVPSVLNFGSGLVTGCNHTSGSLFPVGTTLVTCTATDSLGSSSASTTVLVTDTQAPVVTVPANIFTTNPVVTFTASAMDNVDGSIPVTCSPASGSTFAPGRTTVTCVATDAHENRGLASFKVVVNGEAPILSLPGDFFVEATGPAGALVTYSATAVQGEIVTCDHASGSIFPFGLTLVTCSATNPFGTETGSFNVIVRDSVAPVLTLPADLTQSASDPSGVAVTFVATATDLIDGPVPVSCSPASGSIFPLGVTTVTCLAHDSNFNFASGSFKITVVNLPPPILTLPANMVVEAAGPAGTVVTYSASASGGAAISCTPPSGSLFSIATTTVQCSAANASGTTTGSFNVTVRDTTPPTLTLPADITAEATSAAGATVNFTASATDLVDGSVAVTCLSPSGSIFPLGISTVQCSAADLRANAAHGSFHVTIRDTTPPALTLPADITAEATSAAGAAVNFTASATDLVDGSVAVTCLSPSGSIFPLGISTVQCSAADLHANAAHGSFHVTIRDTTPPALTLPADITAEATSAAGAAVNFTASATDLVDGSVAVTCLPSSGSTFPLGISTVQCSATDLHANTGHGTFHITVVDTTPPTLTLPGNITAEATSASGAVVTYTTSATDLVDGSVTPVCAPSSGSLFPLGTTLVQCSATDSHFNKKAGSFHVLVRDTTAPQIVKIEASPAAIWPPDHRMVPVTITVIATDTVDPHPTSAIVSVTSSQAANGTGDGNTAVDWTITGPLTLELRAERAGSVDRVYTITIQTTDASGNFVRQPIEVRVAQTSRGRATR